MKRYDDKVTVAHMCPACGKRTYRRIRHFPTLGYSDARCEQCLKRNYKPEQVQHHDPRTKKLPEGWQAALEEAAVAKPKRPEAEPAAEGEQASFTAEGPVEEDGQA